MFFKPNISKINMPSEQTQHQTRLISEQFRALLNEPGEHLAPHIQEDMEQAFSTNFDNVIIHNSSSSHILNNILGAKAFTIGSHICFSAEMYNPESTVSRHILAHELAHVVQKRLGSISTGRLAHTNCQRHQLELEAHRAAWAVTQGGQFDCVIPDYEKTPSLWGPAGHYYTVYLTYLNAGASDDDAFKTALFCLLPDQVRELDAYDLAYTYYAKIISDSSGASASIAFASAFSTEPKEPPLTSPLTINQSEYIELIDKGIHCLNGQDAKKETALRGKILNDNIGLMNPLLRGIAHHPFGDSFAHREIGNANKMTECYGGFGHTTQGNEPDNIWSPNRGGIYLDYVRGLHDIACKWTKKSPIIPIDAFILSLTPMLNRSNVDPMILQMADTGSWTSDRLLNDKIDILKSAIVAPNEKACARHMENVAKTLLNKFFKVYDIFEAPIPWADYYMRHRGYIDRSIRSSKTPETADDTLLLITKYAERWKNYAR